MVACLPTFYTSLLGISTDEVMAEHPPALSPLTTSRHTREHAHDHDALAFLLQVGRWRVPLE